MYHIGMTQWIVGNEPLETSCKRLKDCGYDGIEFAADPYKLDADKCVALMKEYGLNCRSLCGLYDETRDLTSDSESGKNAVQYIKDSVDFANKVGAKVIIVVPSPVGRTRKPEGKTIEELLDTAANNIRQAADYAKEHDVKLAIECINRYETYLVNTLAQGKELVEKINHPSVGIMADLFHMSIEEQDLVTALLSVKDILLHVHIADNTREAAGMGYTDFKSVIRTLNSFGYNGSLTMEFMYRLSDPYAAQELSTQTALIDRYAKQSIDYIRLVENSVK